MVAWASLDFPLSELHPIASEITLTGFSHIATRGSTSHVRMSSAEVIRSRAQSNRRGLEEQGICEDGETRTTAPTMEKLGLTVPEAAALSSLGQTSIYKAIREGRLRIRKYGTRTIITRADLASFLENLPDELERPEGRYGRPGGQADNPKP